MGEMSRRRLPPTQDTTGHGAAICCVWQVAWDSAHASWYAQATELQCVGSAKPPGKLPLTKVQPLSIRLFYKDMLPLALSHAACSSHHYVKQHAQCFVPHHMLLRWLPM